MATTKGRRIVSAVATQYGGARVAAFLRQAYPDARAKRIARDFDVSERQGERWLAGELPTTAQLAKMAGKLGWRFWHSVGEAFIGHADPGAVLARIEATERHAIQTMHEVQEVRALIERERAELVGRPVGQVHDLAEQGGASADREVARRASARRHA